MPEISWEKPAEEALSKVPLFVRGMVKKTVDDLVQQCGKTNVSIDDLMEAKEKFREKSGYAGHFLGQGS